MGRVVRLRRLDSPIGSDASIQQSGTAAGAVLRIESIEAPDAVHWRLPPSKSHMIRWLVLAAQSEGTTEIAFEGVPGEDIASMGRCLEMMGAGIERGDGSWVVRGAKNGLSIPDGVLDCGNSGTAARIMTAIAAGMALPVTIDGDESLRGRDASSLSSVLTGLGCRISSERLPCTVTGRIQPKRANLDQSSSSQPLTALLLASPSFPEGTEILLTGEPVSRGYSHLTMEICEACGSPNVPNEEILHLDPWRVIAPDRVLIYGEASLVPMSMLFGRLFGTGSKVEIPPGDAMIAEAIESLGNTDGRRVDLRDASDIISPAAALMAIGNGGSIVGARHVREKESDRIRTTVEMLAAFGMSSRATDDGIEIPGGQFPEKPDRPVETHGDHRLVMTAAVLASKVGGIIINPGASAVTDPEFIERLTGLGE